MDDFKHLLPEVSASAQTPTKRKAEQGSEREWLRVYETLPPQMLNAYGEAKYTRLSDAVVWEAMTKPLRSGAKYMTEYASADKERRGIAANRWLKSLLDYIEYNEQPKVRRQNEYIWKEGISKEFYEEVDRIKPSVAYCLAPKKVSEKTGASSLRAAVSVGAPSGDNKSPEQIGKHAKILYEWLHVETPSRIRMMMNWQAAGGLPYVVSVHHRASQCFLYHGNSAHEGPNTKVSLSEFQECIKRRHAVGSLGFEADVSTQEVDYSQQS